MIARADERTGRATPGRGAFRAAVLLSIACLAVLRLPADQPLPHQPLPHQPGWTPAFHAATMGQTLTEETSAARVLPALFRWDQLADPRPFERISIDDGGVLYRYDGLETGLAVRIRVDAGGTAFAYEEVRIHGGVLSYRRAPRTEIRTDGTFRAPLTLLIAHPADEKQPTLWLRYTGEWYRGELTEGAVGTGVAYRTVEGRFEGAILPPESRESTTTEQLFEFFRVMDEALDSPQSATEAQTAPAAIAVFQLDDATAAEFRVGAVPSAFSPEEWFLNALPEEWRAVRRGERAPFSGSAPSISNRDPDQYADIDAHALNAPAEVRNSVEELAAWLIAPARNDLEKVRAIYRWMTDAIRYDMAALRTGRYGDLSAGGVLRSRRSVCSGYAALFRALAVEAEVRVVTIIGYAKGLSYRSNQPFRETNHAWNAVMIEGSWHLIDATWGAGHSTGTQWVKAYDEFWFLTPPDRFVFSHLSEDSEWQLLEDRVSMDEFLRLPNLRGTWFRLGVGTPRFRDFLNPTEAPTVPTSYYTPLPGAYVLEAPPSGELVAGQPYRFAVTIPGAASVAAVVGRSWDLFTPYDGVWVASVTKPKGTLNIVYNASARNSSHRVFLRYAVK